jgi:hypothetical protein
MGMGRYPFLSDTGAGPPVNNRDLPRRRYPNTFLEKPSLASKADLKEFGRSMVMSGLMLRISIKSLKKPAIVLSLQGIK